MNAHTPTPWSVTRDGYRVVADGHHIQQICYTANSARTRTPEAAANARHIVHCVNTHASLVEALEAIVSKLEFFGEWEDGCFYYNSRACPELESVLADAHKALRATALAAQPQPSREH